MTLNEQIVNFMSFFFINGNNMAKRLLFEQRNKNNLDPESERVLADLNRFYVYFYSSNSLFEYENAARFIFSEPSLSDSLRAFLKGGFLSKRENVMPPKETSLNAEEFLATTMVSPLDLFGLIKPDTYLTSYRNEVPGTNVPSVFFKYYREFSNLSESEQEKIITFLSSVSSKTKNKFIETKNKDVYTRYAYYSVFLFLSHYFCHINGKDRTDELNGILKESAETMVYLFENCSLSKWMVYDEIISPLNFFILQSDKEKTANVYNELFSFSEYGTEKDGRKRITSFLYKNNLSFTNILNVLKNEEIKSVFLSEDEYTEGFYNFVFKVASNPFYLDPSAFDSLQKKFSFLDSDTQKIINDFINRINRGVEKSFNMLERVKTKNSLNFENLSGILEKPFEELSYEDIRTIDSFFREYILLKKENSLTYDERFPLLLDKFFKYADKFMFDGKNTKEIFYKHTEIKDDRVKKITDQIFEKETEIEKKRETLSKLEDEYYYSFERDKKASEMLKIVGIELPFEPDDKISKVILKALNYVLYLKDTRNPLILKLYFEGEESNIEESLVFSERLAKHTKGPTGEIIQKTFSKEIRIRSSEKRGTFDDFSLSYFLTKMTDAFDLENDVEKYMLNVIFDKDKRIFRDFFINTNEFYNFLKIKMLYEYSGEKNVRDKTALSIKEDPVWKYLEFADVLSNGKLKEAEESFKEIEKFTERYMNMIAESPEMFWAFRNAFLDKTGYFYYDDSVKESLGLNDVRKEKIRRSGVFKRNIEKLAEKYENSLFWRFFADTALFSAVPLLNAKYTVKKHYENLYSVSEKMSPYKIYNADNGFLTKHYKYFISLSRNIRASILNRKGYYSTSASLSNNTDYCHVWNEENLKYMNFLIKNPYVPVTFPELQIFYKEKELNKNQNFSDFKKAVIVQTYLNGVRPSVIRLPEGKTLTRIKERYKTDKNPIIPTRQRIPDYFLIDDLAFTDGKGNFYGIALKDPFGKYIPSSYDEEHNKWEEMVLNKLSFNEWSIDNPENILKIVLNKAEKGEFDFKNMMEFFAESASSPEKYKKEAVSFFKEPLSLVKDKKISKDIIIKTYLNKETFLNNDKHILLTYCSYYSGDRKNLKINKKDIPVATGPLEYKQTPEEALEESAGVFLVNFKSEIEKVKEYIKEIRMKNVKKETNEPGID